MNLLVANTTIFLYAGYQGGSSGGYNNSASNANNSSSSSNPESKQTNTLNLIPYNLKIYCNQLCVVLNIFVLIEQVEATTLGKCFQTLLQPWYSCQQNLREHHISLLRNLTFLFMM